MALGISENKRRIDQMALLVKEQQSEINKLKKRIKDLEWQMKIAFFQ